MSENKVISPQKPDIDKEYIKKEKFYLSLILIAIFVVAILAICLMAYMTFFVKH